MGRYDIALGKAPVPPPRHDDVTYHLTEYHKLTMVAKSRIPAARSKFLSGYNKKRERDEISEKVFKAVMKEFYKDSDKLGEVRVGRRHDPEYDEDFFNHLQNP